MTIYELQRRGHPGLPDRTDTYLTWAQLEQGLHDLSLGPYPWDAATVVVEKVGHGFDHVHLQWGDKLDAIAHITAAEHRLRIRAGLPA